MPELAKGDARECADMIIGAHPDVLRAKGIASQICYPGATHMAATEFTTGMISPEATYVTTSQATYVASAEATYVASAEATPTKTTAAACIRRIDTEAAA
jgi:hypothetical protein